MEYREVILVDDDDRAIGVMEKMEAHQKGLLHRAFSVFIINKAGELLLQQRALSKYHSPGLWTNTCCSHPAPGELTTLAASRRLKEEMGIVCPLAEIGTFTYQTEFDNGLIEYEFDHVFVGQCDAIVNPDKSEVEAYKWISIADLDEDVNLHKEQYTYWFHLAYPIAKSWLGYQKNFI